MNSKLLVVTVLAFGLSLVGGRYIFAPAPDVVASQEVVVPVENKIGAVAKTVSTAAVSLEDNTPVAPRSMPFTARGIDRTFKKTDIGLVNKNTRMTTELSNLYSEGVVHSAPAQFNASVQWRPATQEHRRGPQIVSINQMDGGARARLDARGGSERVVYPKTYEDTEEHFYVRPEGGIEHDIVLQNPPATLDPVNGLAYTGFLKLSKNLTMWDDRTQITGDYTTKNGIFFKNSFNNTVFYLRAPIAYDQNVSLPGGGLDNEKQALPENQKYATACEYQISFEEGGIKLAVVTAGKWLLSNERSYPVVIDPNFGPFGLADGDPPIYIGAAGSDVIIPAFNSGTKLPIEDFCQQFPPKIDDGYGHIPMPFDFVFYGVNHPAGSFLFVHIDGFASWIPPFPIYNPITRPFDPCFDNGNPFYSGNTPIPNATYPRDAFFVYWDDIQFSADPTSGIYYFVDGIAPSRRLIVEWHKMNYFQGGTATDVISFNMVLYECNSVIQYIYKYMDEVDRGLMSIGIEDPTGSIGIQYAFNPQTLGEPELMQGTSVSFSVSPLSNIRVTATNTTGCAPLTACFSATVDVIVPVCVQTSGGLSIPPSFGFRWIFQDGSEAFTRNVCHTFTVPGNYPVQLVVTDEFGNRSTITNNLNVTVCDIPPVILTADPQGGNSPLTVNIAMRSVSPTILQGGAPNPTITFNNALTHILIERLGDQNEPGVVAPFMDIPGTTATVRFDTPGNYRITGIFGGTSFGLQTSGSATLFITVTDPNSFIQNSLVITDSKIKIDWAGKLPNAQGILVNPNNDTITIQGWVNTSGYSLSQLAGQNIFIALNAFNPIFNGFLDAQGQASQADNVAGTSGSFKLSPNGYFVCTVKGDYAASLSANSRTERRLLSANYRIQIGEIFSTPGTMVTYDYFSSLSRKAQANYKFGKIFRSGAIDGAPPGFGSPSQQQLQVSGAFLVTQAKISLQGDTVNAKLKGILARAGGDDLRPSATSDVVVKLGGFTETLNFSTTPTFKTTGKPPAQRFSFKTRGNTRIQKLGWANQAGNFYIDVINMPNADVGIQPQLGAQPLKLIFIVTPDNGQQYIGTTVFDIFKVSDTEYKH